MSEIPADYLSVRVQPPRQLLGFQEAHRDGMQAYAFGTPLQQCPIQGPLEAAWWRRGWRQAFAEARVAAALESMDQAERRELEMDPEFNWEAARC